MVVAKVWPRWWPPLLVPFVGCEWCWCWWWATSHRRHLISHTARYSDAAKASSSSSSGHSETPKPSWVLLLGGMIRDDRLHHLLFWLLFDASCCIGSKRAAFAELYKSLHCLPLLCIVYTPLETLGRRTWSMDIRNMVLPFKYHQFQVSVKLTTGPTRMFIHYLSTAEKGMPNKTKVPIHPPILGYMILTFLIPYHSRDWYIQYIYIWQLFRSRPLLKETAALTLNMFPWIEKSKSSVTIRLLFTDS